MTQATAKRLCALEECNKVHYCQGWCQMHYQRWRRCGDPRARKMLRGAPALERFFSHVEIGDCWTWVGSKIRGGYGVFRDERRAMVAHRWLWLALVGEIGEGMVLDHLCRNRACVNPDHLEPVTQAENVGRGVAAVRGRLAGITRDAVRQIINKRDNTKGAKQ